MANFLLIFLCLFLGILFKKLNKFPENFSSSLNSFIIYVSLPSLILLYIPELNLGDFSPVAVLLPWVLFLLSYVFFHVIARIWTIPKKTFVCLVLCSGLGNTSFLGLAMVEFYYGKPGLPFALLTDQLGTFLVLATLGIPYLLVQTGENFSKKDVFQKIITFPPFLALVVAFFLIPLTIPMELKTIFKRLGDTLVPLAIFSVGYTWKWKSIQNKWKYLVLGLGFKLILAPLLCIIYFYIFLSNPSLVHKVTLFEIAMPPMVTASILAMDKNQDPDLAAGLVGLGLLLSFVTLFFWWKMIEIHLISR